MTTVNYTPPPTLREFMVSPARVRAVRGPVGSGKSTACAMELFRRACEAPIDPTDGVRRSKMVVVRNTLQQLRTTNLVTITKILRPVMRYKVSDQTVEIRLPGIESDWLFLPLDTEENIQRLLSLELTYAWVSEFREISPELVRNVLSRTGRYPGGSFDLDPDEVPEHLNYDYGLIMESNSFTEDSPWFETLEEKLPGNWSYHIQPGAFDPGAENREPGRLPPNYYEDLMESNTEDWVDQYIHNKIGPSLSGQAVFRKAFRHAFHVAKSRLIPTPGYPLIIGTDTGRNPAAIVGQIDVRGRVLVFDAIAEENMGMENFLKTKLRPLLNQQKYASNPSFLVLDPACRQKSQIGEEDVLTACKRCGFAAIPAMTNALDPRLRAVEKFLLEQRDGGPALMLDPVGCAQLVLALGSRYRYKIKKDGVLEDSPEKKHPWSDLADGLQYLCLGTSANLRGKIMHRMGLDSNRKYAAEPSAAGWS